MPATLNKKIYFMGIGGTGMAPVAGLMQEAGYQVSGSDNALYPPMSTMLEELGIPVAVPYSADNLRQSDADLIVVANVLSRGHPEVELMLETGRAYTSFPQLLNETFLRHQAAVVVTGTHGKTTTSALLAHLIEELGGNPGFLIGGLPRNFPLSFRAGGGKIFVIEGDEYDTAFFDKGPKFLHYCPQHLLLNNLEFDHADIFENLAAIVAQFSKLVDLVANPAQIVANWDDANIRKLLLDKDLAEQVVRVSTLGHDQEADIVVGNSTVTASATGQPIWQSQISTRFFGPVNVATQLAGAHNLANIAQAIGIIQSLIKAGLLPALKNTQSLTDAIASFQGVRRRLDHLGHGNGIDVYEDFAHHPTAVRLVIEGLRKMHPSRRLVVAFEPRNASSRRNVFENDFAASLKFADLAFIGHCPVDERIPVGERMNTKAMQEKVGQSAMSFDDNQKLLEDLHRKARKGDVVVFMSSSSFNGIQHEFAKTLVASTGSAASQGKENQASL